MFDYSLQLLVKANFIQINFQILNCIMHTMNILPSYGLKNLTTHLKIQFKLDEIHFLVT